MELIIISVLVLVSIGAASAILLGFAAEKFKTIRDPRVDEILAVLPGANCAACGYPSCSALAEALSSGKAPANSCKVGGPKTTEKVAAIIGSGKCDIGEEMKAHVFCNGGLDKSGRKFKYTGIKDCDVAILVNGGDKMCNYGCLGYGTCVRACKFDAIHLDTQGIPIVSKEKCTACGQCVVACPRKLISLIPRGSKTTVDCSSPEKGPYVRTICKVGCIKCGLCIKNCPDTAISYKNGPANIDQNKCGNKLVCVSVCPQKTINRS